MLAGDLFDGGSGQDTFFASDGVTLPAGAVVTNFEVVIFAQTGTSGPDRLFGTSLSDRLYGLSGRDRLYGLGDAD